jgi:hypothetical protein
MHFYLPHMEYEGSIGLVTGKMKKNIDDFYVLVLFMAEKHVLSDKKIASVTRRCRCCCSQKFVPHLQPPPYKLGS